MRIALYQPEIAGNVGAVLRLAACMSVGVDLIEPLGFGYSDKRLKRAGMDYIDHVDVVRHADWEAFRGTAQGRIMLLSTRGETALYEAAFRPDDTLLMGSESAGVPDSVRSACSGSLRIPLRMPMRSLNLGMATGMALAEGLRQTGGLPA
ncbi:MAG: tRNA (cytidine(34)-2'-O)-methyltransferase [Alphaproteobacteria bacterium]|nr:tRNA (cytidine(34)-2'-O)-methyltransferase [Alphaproteobacteria bacterium]